MSGKRLLLLLLVGLLLLGSPLFYFLGSAAWRLWNVPVMMPSFADTRSLLSGIDAQRLGYDPFSENPLDPFGHVVVYPRLWLWLGVFPVTADNTALLAVIQIVLFLSGLFLFLDRFDRPTALLVATLVVSPGAMLCYERANADLVAFFLLACALALLARWRALSVLLVELAAFLKLYPIIALGCLLREPKKKFALWLANGLAIFGLYAALTWQDIGRTLSGSPKGVGFNYGVTVPGLWLLDLTSSRPVADTVIALSFLLVYFLLLYVLYRGYRDQLSVPVENLRALDAFRVGALIYIGTFLQGNTWNYRLIFLIFALPQLAEWARADVPRLAGIARLSLALVSLSAWLPLFGASEPPSPTVLGGAQLIADELANWGLWVCLTYLFLASLPDWIRAQIDLFFAKYGRRSRLPA